MESNRKYRILLVGDYSNLHSQLGSTLRSWGHEVTVMSAGSGFQATERDIDISRRPGKVGGLILAAKCLWPLHRHMRGYDIVAIQNPFFLHLKPSRLRYFFDRLRQENRSVFLSAAGTDPVYMLEALDENSPLRYNEFRIDNNPAPFALQVPGRIKNWLQPDMLDYTQHVYTNIDGVVSALFEYHIAVSRRMPEVKLAYGGIPVDTHRLKPFDKPVEPGNVKLFLGRHRGRLVEKGTDILEAAALRAIERNRGHATLEIVENVPYAEYVEKMSGCDILLDQIYSYTPATNALIAMSRGLATVSGGEPQYYDFIDERVNRPIINAPTDIESLTEVLVDAISNTEKLEMLKRKSREFVVKHNDAETVARRYLDFWTSCLLEKEGMVNHGGK